MDSWPLVNFSVKYGWAVNTNELFTVKKLV
jgi:hypothetical protein